MIRYQWKETPICGIVADMKLGSITEETTGKFMGISIFNDFEATTGQQICIKTEQNVNEAIRNIKKFYYSKGYDDNLFLIKTLEDHIMYEIREEQNILKLMTGFSLICILMTVLTIVGLSGYHVKTNEKDNAVRNVFGCSKIEILCRLAFNFTLPVVISAIVAVPTAWIVIDRWLQGYVIRCTNSPFIYITAVVTVFVIVISSILLYAVRMLRTNPAEVLKKE